MFLKKTGHWPAFFFVVCTAKTNYSPVNATPDGKNAYIASAN